VELALTYEPNGTDHSDLVLRLGDREYRCDSYYLLLDNALLPGQEDEAKVRAVLRRLLEQWAVAVEGLRARDVVYLPFDFSDQCTCWLAVERIDDASVSITPGWSLVEGWTFMPSEIGSHLRQLPDFKPDEEALRMDRAEVTAAIRSSIDRAS